jgi:tetratricopeptide (TPR) repeat protein
LGAAKTLNIIAVLLVSFLLAVPHVALGQSSSVWHAVDATALSQQVIELSKQGRYSEALPLAHRALAMREKALGPDHVDVAVSLYLLMATLYQNQGRYADAEPLFKRVIGVK